MSTVTYIKHLLHRQHKTHIILQKPRRKFTIITQEIEEASQFYSEQYVKNNDGLDSYSL